LDKTLHVLNDGILILKGNKLTKKVSNITFGMAFNNAVSLSAAIGSTDPDSIQARFIELLTILERVAPEYGVDLTQEGYEKRKAEKKERELPEGAGVFTVDGDTWIDFRGAKDKGTVNAKHPDFKSFDYKSSVWMFDQEGNPNEEAGTLVKAAEAAIA
jgi:hypothetical protein